MGAFHYTAIDQKGDQHKGMLEAESVKQCRQLLREKNFIPLKVTTAHQKKLKAGEHKISAKSAINSAMSNKELSLITRQLATLFAAGLPVEEVLTAVAEQTEKQRTSSLISAVRSRVMEGYSLANAMREFPNAFSPLYCSTVAAGEKSGHLDVVLQRLADYTEQQYQMKQKIQNALIYPGIMICVSMGIVGFLLEYVVPKMVSVYSNVGQALPLMTQVLISISDSIKEFGVYFLIFLIGFIFIMKRQFKHNLIFREKVQRLMLKLPLLGNATKIINTARFARTFAILSSAGVSVLEAMSISTQLITNIPIRKAVEEATNHIREGANIHLALKRTKYFPPMSIHLIASGESSGQLENMLERAANNQDNEIKQLIDTALALFEPAIILIMGAVVLFIVLAILLPIFQLDQLTG
jgi:general secretion pathway protein F